MEEEEEFMDAVEKLEDNVVSIPTAVDNLIDLNTKKLENILEEEESINPNGTNREEDDEKEEFQASDELEEENTGFKKQFKWNICKHCDFGSNDKRALNDHVRSTHGKLSQTKCSKCIRTFSECCELEDHMKYVHVDTRITCTVASCKLKVINSATLEKHMAERHAGKGKLRCQNCNFQTVYSGILKQHIAKNHQA